MTVRLRTLAVVALTCALLLVAVPAFAHVTVRTDNPAPEAFAKYTIRVPNESEEAATIKIELLFPAGFSPGNYQPVQGWDISIDNDTMTIEGGAIEPGQFQEFSFSAQNPADAGDLTFPAIQTYDDGEEARWVGEPDAEQPAPVVTIEGEAGGHGGSHDEVASEPTADGASNGAGTDAADDGTLAASSGTSPLSITSLVLALIAVALAAGAFVRARR